jgi:hypothetical protein
MAVAEESAFLDQPRDAAAAFRPLPAVGAERLAIEGFQFGDDARLQPGEPGFQWLGVHIVSGVKKRAAEAAARDSLYSPCVTG